MSLGLGVNDSTKNSYDDKTWRVGLNSDQALQITSILISGAFVGWQIRSAKKREVVPAVD